MLQARIGERFPAVMVDSALSRLRDAVAGGFAVPPG